MKGEGERGKWLAWFCPKKTSQAYQQLEITHLLSFSFISSSNLKYINYCGVIAVMCWTISGEGVVTYWCCLFVKFVCLLCRLDQIYDVR